MTNVIQYTLKLHVWCFIILLWILYFIILLWIIIYIIIYKTVSTFSFNFLRWVVLSF